jgi:hypothetical protein
LKKPGLLAIIIIIIDIVIIINTISGAPQYRAPQ